MSKSIILTSEDVPTKLQLIHAVSRLTKCYKLLAKSRGKNDTEDPTSLMETANFLDMLVRREGRSLRKDEDAYTDAHILSMADKFLEYLTTLPKEDAYAVLQKLRERLEVND